MKSIMALVYGCTLAALAATPALSQSMNLNGVKRTPAQQVQAKKCAVAAGFKISPTGGWNGSEASPEAQAKYAACKKQFGVP